jgi:hypothetical protein
VNTNHQAKYHSLFELQPLQLLRQLEEARAGLAGEERQLGAVLLVAGPAQLEEVVYVELLLLDLAALRGWPLVLRPLLHLPDVLVSDRLGVQRHLPQFLELGHRPVPLQPLH